MIIPVRCFTCGEVLGDKWVPYVTAIQNDKNKISEEINSETNYQELQYIDVNNPQPEKSIEGKILDEMNIHKYCYFTAFLKCI